MNGAALVYNRMLADEAERPERADEFTDRLSSWGELVSDRASDLAGWRDGSSDFWDFVSGANHRVPSPAERAFVDGWLDLALAQPSAAIAENEHARMMIADRERQLKRGHARLGNPARLEGWGGSSGAEPLEFRWSYAARLMADIRDGLGRPPRETSEEELAGA